MGQTLAVYGAWREMNQPIRSIQIAFATVMTVDMELVHSPIITVIGRRNRWTLTHWGRAKWSPFRRRHLKGFFMHENFVIFTEFHWNFVPYGICSNKPALVYTTAWHRTGGKSSEPMSSQFYVTLWRQYTCSGRLQWVNGEWRKEDNNTRSINVWICV